MPLDVWIPADTLEPARAALPSFARVRAYPPAGGWPTEPQPADLLVATDTEAALAALPHLAGLRVVQTVSAGVERIVDRLPAGLTLCNARGVHDVGVAEWVVMAILADFRRLPALVSAQGAGAWPDDDRRQELRGDELAGSTVLVVGFGSIGHALAERLVPFGVRVVGVARREHPGAHLLADLPGLLPTADVVVVLLPLTPATRGLVGADALARMKPGALLVNAGRGGVVDTAALLSALRAGRVRAVLDVTDPEPLPANHPLWSAPGVLITPHVAGDVRGEPRRAWAFVAEQLARLRDGEPLRNVVAEGY
jgi:phosphoglycerate dehydrogenase-like enzyme